MAKLTAVRDFCFKYLSNKQKSSGGAIKPYEVVQGVVVSPEEWVATNGLSTPSFKIKREKIKIRFAAEIAAEVARVAKK